MRIAIDARWIYPEISGIGQYTRELISHTAAIDSKNEFLLLFDHGEVEQMIMGLPSVKKNKRFAACRVAYSPFDLRSQLALPGVLRKEAIDVYHSPNYMLPFPAFPRNRRGRIRCVATVHDLIPLIFPHFAPRARKARLFPLFRRIMLECGMRSDVLIAPSQSTRNDIVEHLHIPSHRVDDVLVIPEGVDTFYAPPDSEVTEPHTLLYVGRLDPYKNVVALVEALAAVRARVPDAVLQIIGPADSRYPEARNRVMELGLEDHVHWMGYVDNDRLRDAYRRAAVFVLPSRYEGFGLPVLEAMACGTPVICTRASSLPEVAGDAALLVPPDDNTALTDAILEVLLDTELAATLRTRGLEHAKGFTWEKTAQATTEAYRRACGG